MYRKKERQLPLENFYLPFGGKLDPENRWVKLAKLIPWDVIEDKYASLFDKKNMGAPAKPVRMALGALIIKEKAGSQMKRSWNRLRKTRIFNILSD